MLATWGSTVSAVERPWPTIDGSGLFRSSNHGESWNRISNGLKQDKSSYPSLMINRVCFNPKNSSEIFAATDTGVYLSLIHISEPTRLGMISYAVFCLKKKKKTAAVRHTD